MVLSSHGTSFGLVNKGNIVTNYLSISQPAEHPRYELLLCLSQKLYIFKPTLTDIIHCQSKFKFCWNLIKLGKDSQNLNFKIISCFSWNKRFEISPWMIDTTQDEKFL